MAQPTGSTRPTTCNLLLFFTEVIISTPGFMVRDRRKRRRPDQQAYDTELIAQREPAPPSVSARAGPPFSRPSWGYAALSVSATDVSKSQSRGGNQLPPTATGRLTGHWSWRAARMGRGRDRGLDWNQLKWPRNKCSMKAIYLRPRTPDVVFDRYHGPKRVQETMRCGRGGNQVESRRNPPPLPLG